MATAGLRTNSGAATVRMGRAGEGKPGRFVIQIKTIANPCTVKGRIPGADADIDLQVNDASDPDLAAAATITAAGIFWVADLGLIDIAITFGAGDTVYSIGFAAAS